MTFEEILDHAMAMLQRRGRVTSRTLKRQFNPISFCNTTSHRENQPI
jgi:hypothetical protein